MSDYLIFGKGSSGNGWFSNKLNDFHDSTKKYDPISHYSVEYPMKGAHWLVEKSSKGLADAGIGEGWNRRLNQEADENGDNFGLGSQRMGIGIGSVLGAMYGYSSLANSGSGAPVEGAPTEFNPNGLPNGSQYANDIPTMNNGGSWWQKLLGPASSMAGQQGGGQGGQYGNQGGTAGAQRGYGYQQPPNMGNPALTAALTKLVEQQEASMRQQERGLLSGAVGEQQKPYGIFGLTPEEIQRLTASYENDDQYQDPYGERSWAGGYR